MSRIASALRSEGVEIRALRCCRAVDFCASVIPVAMVLLRGSAAATRVLLPAGDGDSAERHLEFYDEYLSVLDLTEEFYLQTIDVVFQRYLLPKGELEHRGRLVKPEMIRDIALLTVEGENDDISGIGQTQAAHALCSGLPDALKEDYVQPHVGHYGVFNGARFRDEIYPKVRSHIWTQELALARGNVVPLPKRIEAA